jgi:hypothetical protein
MIVIVGYIGMLIGAIDPMEGSLLILPGSGLVVLGIFIGHAGHNQISYRSWVFALIAVGVSALWGLSAVGGFGGDSELSGWWGVLILPYLIGWSMGIWGPGSPRWVLLIGSIVSLWYLAILAMALQDPGAHGWASSLAAIVLGVTGALTIGGCIYRLKNPDLQP